MPRRRANGEGSVFRCRDGSWRAACRGGSPSFRARTRDEAIRRREAYLRSSYRIRVLPRQARDSFAAVAAAWLESRRSALRPRTVESYHATLTRHIIPAIGEIPVALLTPDHIEKAMDSGKSPRTRNYIRTVCHLVLAYAKKRHLVSENVAADVAAVKVDGPEREMPSPAQWEALVASINQEAACPRAVLLVVAFAGLRVGEACGLKWGDYREGHIYVTRAADRHGNLVPLKTKAGRRFVPVSEETAVALEAWHIEQASVREKHARTWRDAIPDLMFTTRYGTPWHPRNILRVAHRVTERAGIGRHGVHYLRHVAISMMIADGSDMKSIQTVAGHSSIRVTYDTYGHLIPGHLQRMAEAMNRRGRVTSPEGHESSASPRNPEHPKPKT